MHVYYTIKLPFIILKFLLYLLSHFPIFIRGRSFSNRTDLFGISVQPKIDFVWKIPILQNFCTRDFLFGRTGHLSAYQFVLQSIFFSEIKNFVVLKISVRSVVKNRLRCLEDFLKPEKMSHGTLGKSTGATTTRVLVTETLVFVNYI